jgi:hypothetical protein
VDDRELIAQVLRDNVHDDGHWRPLDVADAVLAALGLLVEEEPDQCPICHRTRRSCRRQGCRTPEEVILNAMSVTNG